MMAAEPMAEGFEGYLEELMKRAGLDRKKLAALSGVSTNTIHAWLRGAQTPTSTLVRDVARALGVKTEDLLAAYERFPHKQDVVFVPKVTGRVSAGPGSSGDMEYWPYLPKPTQRGHEFISVRVSGDCMEPRVHDGEWVLVDKTAVPEDGKLVVAIHEGETIVKLFERRGGRSYLVALQNRPPIELDADTEIIGVVIKVEREP